MKHKYIVSIQEVSLSFLNRDLHKNPSSATQEMINLITEITWLRCLSVTVDLVKVSDFSRKPFCFRSVFSSLLLFFLFFFSFFLYHLVCSAITLSILNRFTSNFHNTLIMNRRFDSYTF